MNLSSIETDQNQVTVPSNSNDNNLLWRVMSLEGWALQNNRTVIESLCNANHYGSSRITQPANHNTKETMWAWTQSRVWRQSSRFGQFSEACLLWSLMHKYQRLKTGLGLLAERKIANIAQHSNKGHDLILWLAMVRLLFKWRNAARFYCANGCFKRRPSASEALGPLGPTLALPPGAKLLREFTVVLSSKHVLDKQNLQKGTCVSNRSCFDLLVSILCARKTDRYSTVEWVDSARLASDTPKRWPYSSLNFSKHDRQLKWISTKRPFCHHRSSEVHVRTVAACLWRTAPHP